MRDLFADHRASVDHAKNHVIEARQIAEAFFNEEPYETVIEDDPHYPGRKIQYVQLARPLPDRIPLLLSDASKNIRSILDHIGYTVAVANGKDGQSAYFPFGDNFKEANSRRWGKAKDIPQEIFDLMLAFKPYKRGDNALWALNKLANTNKHEAFVRVVLFAESIHMEGGGIWLGSGPRESTNGKIPVAWLPFGASHLNYNLKISAALRLNDFKGITVKEPAIAFLEHLCSKVEQIIVGVERQARRLGLNK